MAAGESFQRVERSLGEVCAACGRARSEVTLVAVSKTVGVPEVEQAIAAGARDFGENRPDQLMLKADALPDVRWHFIGNIQSRRIRDIVGRAVLIHSLFEESHAVKIDQIAAERGIVQDVLLEVNVSGEESKSGLEPAAVPAMLDACRGLSHVRVRGLMTMAPIGEASVARATFEGLAQLRAQLAAGMDAEEVALFSELSMGMTDDWPEAVAAGATIVRIGRAIFA